MPTFLIIEIALNVKVAQVPDETKVEPQSYQEKKPESQCDRQHLAARRMSRR
jgi:hypothetical protein